MLDFVKRMIKERDELKEKINKLSKFYASAVEEELDITLEPEQIEAMAEQLEYMEKYYNVLCKRIGYFVDVEEEINE